MTRTENYTVRDAEVIVTATVSRYVIDLTITVDLAMLDADEPDHSAHQLINYFALNGYKTGTTHWWCKTHRRLSVKTGAQARRVIKSALAKIDDAIEAALIARAARKSHMADIFAD